MADGDVIFLTGCASGIGRHLAGRYAERGLRVMATDVDAGGLERAAQGWRGEVRTTPLDVRDPEAWKRALDEAEDAFGPVDVLMNVAGYLHPAWSWEIEPAQVDRHFDVNVKGVVHGTTAAARRMKARGAGHIVNIGSLASLSPVPGLSLYSASKFAVRGFSLSVAMELEPHGVSVSVVLPDAVETPMLELQEAYEQAALTFSGTPLTVEDVAEVLDRVLERRPFEVSIPPSRGGLAKIVATLPDVGRRLAPLMVELGRRKQRRRRG